MYRDIAQSILAIYPRSDSRICVRLPWEFNLPSQTLAARNARGQWSARLYIDAYRQIATIFRRASRRFYFDWCPNIGLGGIDPATCYPGDDLVDVISFDVYYHGQYDRQDHRDAGRAIFNYRQTQPFGLDSLSGVAARRGKLIGISEWGVDDNSATEFTRLMAQWIVAQGDRLSHHNYWDRVDGGIATQLSSGRLPAIGAVYRNAFGR